jgi:hypothetical protein
MTNYAFIGDIHSHAENLHLILDKIAARGKYKLVFLGDIFDYSAATTKYSNPREVWGTLLKLKDAVILNSNHQEKLLRYLKGNKVKLETKGITDTVEKLGLRDITTRKASDLLEWLSRMPYFYDVYADGVSYKLAHALYSSRLVRVKEEGFNSKEKQNCLYGPVDILTEGGYPERLKWWLRIPSEQNYVRVAGHYHTVFTSPYSLVLDGSCGSNDRGHLAAYLTDSKEVISTAPRLIKTEIAVNHYEYSAGERLAPRLISSVAEGTRR